MANPRSNFVRHRTGAAPGADDETSRRGRGCRHPCRARPCGRSRCRASAQGWRPRSASRCKAPRPACRACRGRAAWRRPRGWSLPLCRVEQARCRRSRDRGGATARPGSPFSGVAGATHSCGALDGQLCSFKRTSGGEDCQPVVANRRVIASQGRGSRGERYRSRACRGSSLVVRQARQGGGLAQQWRRQDAAAFRERGCCGAPPNGGKPRCARVDRAAPLSLSGAARGPCLKREGSGAAAGSVARLLSSGGACGPSPIRGGSGARAGGAAGLPLSGCAFNPRPDRAGSGATAVSGGRLIRAGRRLPSACRLYRQHAPSPIRARAEPAAAPGRFCQHVGFGPESAESQGRSQWIRCWTSAKAFGARPGTCCGLRSAGKARDATFAPCPASAEGASAGSSAGGKKACTAPGSGFVRRGASGSATDGRGTPGCCDCGSRNHGACSSRARRNQGVRIRGARRNQGNTASDGIGTAGRSREFRLVDARTAGGRVWRNSEAIARNGLGA